MGGEPDCLDGTSHFRKKLLEPSEIAKETSIALWQAELDKLNLNSDRKN